jgi:hypothetical protein
VVNRWDRVLLTLAGLLGAGALALALARWA